MGLLKIPVRYLSMHSASPEDNVESNIKHTETIWDIETEEVALVLVDVWNKHHIRTHMERTMEVMAKKIAPILQVARKAGIPIIYAPSPEVAKKYSQWIRYAGEGEIPINPPSPKIQSDWPPTEFIKREGKYAKYARLPSEKPPNYKEPLPRWDAIADPIKPKTEDFVVATGNQLHRLLKHRRILHLFYTGFATNICVIGRDYGMNSMRRKGYNLILIRDCTTGIENCYTIRDLLTTKVFILDIERKDSSTTSKDFIKACKTLTPHEP